MTSAEAAIRDSVHHKNHFCGGIIVTKWFRRTKPLPSLQNKDYKSCCGAVACEGESKYLCSTLSPEAEGSPGFRGRAIPGAASLFPWCFPWDELFPWGWGIAFDKLQSCASIHHRTKKPSGKFTSCTLNILHFLLSQQFQCPSSSFHLQLISNPKSSGKGCRGQASPNSLWKQNNPCSRRVTPSRFGQLWLHESENVKTLFACSRILLNTFGKDQVKAT